MQPAARIERRDLAIAEDAVRNGMAAGADGPVLNEAAVRLLLSVRRDFLDALPIAAAVIARRDDGSVVVQGGNSQLEQLMRCPVPEGEDRPLAEVAVLNRPGLHDEIAAFLASETGVRQFAWRDGEAIGARHFTVRLARIATLSRYANRCLLTLLDRTVEVETASSLRSEMLHDSLTGLPNRVGFTEAVETSLKAAEARPFGIVLINLRRFSRFNESLGGVAGDELIITVARRLMSTIRPGDLLARIGGDEFGLMIDCPDPGDMLAVTERITTALQTPFRLSNVELRLDAAIGCSASGDGDSAEELVRHAQFAVKSAKRSGRIESYRPSQARLAHRRFAIETDLRRAIDNGDLTLCYQPVVDLFHDRVAGFEALTRWHHPDHGDVSPAEFIPVAEEAGLIVPLGRWALDEAARTLAGWTGERLGGRALAMAVNVSAMQIAHDDVPAALDAVLSRHGLAGERLTLELTESVIINDPAQATRTLAALKELKAHIALDDFGTGYSSLAYLQRLPIDILKIDRRFVSGMLGDRDAVAIVRAVLGLAEALGMKATAEGVETPELAHTLHALGCRFAQGFHFARALPAVDAIAYARSRNA